MAPGSLQQLKLRIGVVQFFPKLGQVQANLKKAKELTDRLSIIPPGSLDLLCFPEMAFTGYNFESASAVTPFLERPRIGPTSTFCSNLAKKLKCYVTAGYPEGLKSDELERASADDQITSDETEFADEERDSIPVRQIVGANSAVLYGPSGEWIGGYRKTNLFRTDKTWAAAGSGFATYQLPSPLNVVTLAICMDLNPFTSAGWQFETGPYELADYYPDREPDDEPSWSTLQYWAVRLRPLWDGTYASNNEPAGKTKTTTVVVCNRTGEENGATFAGSSALFQMNRAQGRPKLVDMMTKEEEGIRIWTIQLDPSTDMPKMSIDPSSSPLA
ncbi:hypothetical protein NP233_g7434 [Leucocoprinus birnbaumii]|uniref:CN hydrolase domain-containing protein n=1 Tax=Leucocoprinus birnbaumii TaxID=56174 RepID=A0AAD5YUR6_9AGAR|nr:hypothetical protein NP233_g7434 [Leucocoprinus birnbaumii]